MATYKLAEKSLPVPNKRRPHLPGQLLTYAVFCILFAASVWASNPPPLDEGFRLLYDLNFPRAQNEFVAWEQEHSNDPMGPTGEAAGFLFSELHRLGILESQFYVKDSAFAARPKLSPDPLVRERFVSALQRAQGLADRRLQENAKDREALFAATLTSGLNADYAALVEKRNLAALRFTRQSNDWARQLLAVDPECYDAYLASGIRKN